MFENFYMHKQIWNFFKYRIFKIVNLHPRINSPHFPFEFRQAFAVSVHVVVRPVPFPFFAAGLIEQKLTQFLGLLKVFRISTFFRTFNSCGDAILLWAYTHTHTNQWLIIASIVQIMSRPKWAVKLRIWVYDNRQGCHCFKMQQMALMNWQAYAYYYYHLRLFTGSLYAEMQI